MSLFSKTNGHGDIEFEKVYRDRITGFQGACTGIARYVSGCDQVYLVPKVGNDNKPAEGAWFDDDRLIDVESEKRVERTSLKGGPNPTPPRRS